MLAQCTVMEFPHWSLRRMVFPLLDNLEWMLISLKDRFDSPTLVWPLQTLRALAMVRVSPMGEEF